MIQTIFLKKRSILDDKDLLEINFSRSLNIIIGPKGGGKSTLFYLLAGLKENYISKKVIDALAIFDLEFIKAKKFNGEEIFINTLILKKEKEMKENLTKRNDVIFQDDPIKKDINNSNDIKKEKEEYLSNVVKNDLKIRAFVEKIKSIHTHVKAIGALNQSDINWATFYKIKTSIGESDLIIKLNYNNKDLLNKIDEEIMQIDNIIKNNLDQINKYKRYVDLDFNHVYHDKDFNQIYIKTINEILSKFYSMNEELNKKKNQISFIKKVSSMFMKSYKRNIDRINENDISNTIKSFIAKSKEYFIQTAREMVILKNLFEKYVTSDFILKMENQLEERHFLSYKLNDEIMFSQEMLYKILEKILYSPDVKNDLSKWLKKANSSDQWVKDTVFDDSKILEEISKLIKNEIIVLADGKNYEHMSLGEKSIYGIKYKFKKSEKEDLFLDQPEDNLDNHTIAENILKLIESKKDSQTFIVTHNANIGIITKPEVVIVADLHSKNSNPYASGRLISKETNESNSAYYLEGGISYLERRFEIIKGEK